MPRGSGPFPLIIDLHGGAWTKKDRTSDVATCEGLAKAGIVAVALDFRMPPDDGGYPAMVQDVNYAVRWCKSRAAALKTSPDKIGILGVSSGGQTAMLSALRPADPRYAALPLAGGASFDATVRCAVMCWPVIDPLGRYQYAQQKKAAGDAKQADEWIKSHDLYWGSEQAMDEGSPTRALERGEKTPLPPVIYLQGTIDPAHPKPNLERFLAAYRKAGGRVEMHWFEGMSQAFMSEQPTSPATLDAIEKIAEFVHRETR
jgi:acetyl esterase/lipase